MGLLNANRLGAFGFRSKRSSAFQTFLRVEFGLRPKQKHWYDEALTHASLSDDLEEGKNSNERLEFLGDAVLGSIIAKQVFDKFPLGDEGMLTQCKSRLVSRKALNQIGQVMGLEPFIRTKMGQSAIPATVIGNALEALVGAIFMDHGYQKAERAVLRMFEKHQSNTNALVTSDFKTKVQQWAQQSSKRVEYRLRNTTLVDGRNEYQMELLFDGEVAGLGSGPSKKSAEQDAAEQASRDIPL